MRFDGVDDRYFTASVPPFVHHTLELWVNPATTTGDAVLAYVGLPGTNSWTTVSATPIACGSAAPASPAAHPPSRDSGRTSR